MAIHLFTDYGNKESRNQKYNNKVLTRINKTEKRTIIKT